MDVNFELKDIVYKGHKISTYSFGTGEKTVFSFPGFPHSGLIYLRLLESNPSANFRFITYDLPGWIGKSENIFEHTEFTLGECVSIANAVLKSYRVGRYSVIGYSFGSALSLMQTYFDRENIDKLVLVSPVLNCRIIQDEPQVKKINLGYSFKAGFLLREYVLNRFKNYKKVLLADGFPHKLADMYEEMLRNMDSKVLLESIHKLFHTDLSLYLQKLENTKVLVINSPDESELFRKQAEMVRRTLPKESSLFVKGNHEDFVLHPNKEASDALLSFLNS